ncbi:hypothetical protein, partial [Treponema sp. R8-4-B8]
AARATQKRSRGYAPLCVFVPPHFCFCEKLLRSFLIAKAKTSVTAGTLCEMWAKICWKIYRNGLTE